MPLHHRIDFRGNSEYYLQVVAKVSWVDFRCELHEIPPTVSVIISTIVFKQVFMVFGRASPNHYFVGKNISSWSRVLYIWLVPRVEQCRPIEVRSIAKILEVWLLRDDLRSN